MQNMIKYVQILEMFHNRIAISIDKKCDNYPSEMNMPVDM